jgi:uncharacterized membrane protein
MLWLESLEYGLANIVALAEFLLEATSVFCVLCGLVKTGLFALKVRRQHPREFPFIQVRVNFGIWLALALEFQLGADILSTTVSPSLEDLTQLSIIAVIRTFLNYFLNKELEHQYDLQEKAKKV